MGLTRRGLLAGAAAGGGLIVAWWLMPRSYRSPLVGARAEHVFGAWLKVVVTWLAMSNVVAWMELQHLE